MSCADWDQLVVHAQTDPPRPNHSSAGRSRPPAPGMMTRFTTMEPHRIASAVQPGPCGPARSGTRCRSRNSPTRCMLALGGWPGPDRKALDAVLPEERVRAGAVSSLAADGRSNALQFVCRIVPLAPPARHVPALHSTASRFSAVPDVAVHQLAPAFVV